MVGARCEACQADWRRHVHAGVAAWTRMSLPGGCVTEVVVAQRSGGERWIAVDDAGALHVRAIRLDTARANRRRSAAERPVHRTSVRTVIGPHDAIRKHGAAAILVKNGSAREIGKVMADRAVCKRGVTAVSITQRTAGIARLIANEKAIDHRRAARAGIADGSSEGNGQIALKHTVLHRKAAPVAIGQGATVMLGLVACNEAVRDRSAAAVSTVHGAAAAFGRIPEKDTRRQLDPCLQQRKAPAALIGGVVTKRTTGHPRMAGKTGHGSTAHLGPVPVEQAAIERQSTVRTDDGAATP